MKFPMTPMAALAMLCFALPASRAQTSISVDSFDGAPTANEIATFKAYIKTLQPVIWPNTGDMANEYAQGGSGEAIKGMGLMYEVTGDTAILDRMIYFCDVLLTERNDILAAPYGRHTMWTGTITHDWISSQTDPTGTGNAPAGDGAGHLAYCARLILSNPALLTQNVSWGDPYGHGATYGSRAATFIAEADDVYSSSVFPYYINLANGNEYYWSSSNPYQTGQVIPWNQQMMFNHGLVNLADAHAILGDSPSLVTQYDGIVQANLNWFFTGSTTKQTVTDPKGNSAYNWGYAPSANSGEDSNHGSLDVAGFYRTFLIGRYSITSAMMQPFANTYCDLMSLGPKFYAGRVDGTNGTGHGSPTDYVRSGNLFLADLRPDFYYHLLWADLSPGGTTTSMDTFSRFEWAKSKRSAEGYAVGFSPVPAAYSSGQTVTLTTSLGGGFIRYTTDGSTPTTTSGTLYSTPFTVSATTTVKAITYTSGTTSPVSTAGYTVWSAAPSFSPGNGNYGTAQTVTISGPSGAAITYTTDGSTPSSGHGTVYSGPIAGLGSTSGVTLHAIATVSGQTSSNVTSATYTLAAATPSFSPGGGSYTTTQHVAISCATAGASIYYTTDGSTPSSTNGTLYSAAVAISTPTALSAVAIASGLSDSTVATAGYAFGSAAAPTFSEAGGTYSGAQSITLSSSTANATILFTLDGSSPVGNTAGTAYLYTGPITVASSTTVKAYAYAANTAASSIVTAAYTINPLPPGWADVDIGTPPLAGGAAYASGVFTDQGCGADIYGTSDQFNYAYQATSGDITVTAEVTSQTNSNGWAKAGVMIRESTAANASYVGLYLTPSNGIDMQYRNGTGAGAVDLARVSGKAAPYWLKLVRVGSTFTGFSSPDGSTWTQVGTITVTMAAAATAGLPVCSHTTSALSTVSFGNVAIVRTLTGIDLGSPPLAGSTSLSATTYTVKGCGSDIYGTSDQFQYAYDNFSGNLTITARVVTQSNSNGWAKAGVMVRETATANASYVGLYVTPSNGLDLQYRNGTGTSAVDLARVSGKIAPYWLRLVRSGNTFTGYSSPDGSTWTSVGTISVAMATAVTAGLPVCSHNTAALSTVTFDNLSVP